MGTPNEKDKVRRRLLSTTEKQLIEARKSKNHELIIKLCLKIGQLKKLMKGEAHE